MTSESSRWWQRRNQFLMIIGITTLVMVTLCAGVSRLIYLAYYFQWPWTGFNASTGPNVLQYQPSKTLWDWLQLLIVPAVLAGAAFLFNLATTRNEQRIAQQRDQTEHDIALDNQRETLLQDYLDRMSELLLNHHLRESNSNTNTEVRYIARARTLTVLPRLDPNRKGSLLRFLYESGLIGTEKGDSIIDLSEADLANANLSRAKLNFANLTGANLSGAKLRFANLGDAKLSRANLNEANLTGAHLSGAHLNAIKLGRAKLNGANLSRACLKEANLNEADLGWANLSRADLTGAQLNGADLEETNFEEAIYTQEQIEKSKLR